jgi:hypothetical protein
MFRIAEACNQDFCLLCIMIFVIHHLFWVKSGSCLVCFHPRAMDGNKLCVLQSVNILDLGLHKPSSTHYSLWLSFVLKFKTISCYQMSFLLFLLLASHKTWYGRIQALNQPFIYRTFDSKLQEFKLTMIT